MRDFLLNSQVTGLGCWGGPHGGGQGESGAATRARAGPGSCSVARPARRARPRATLGPRHPPQDANNDLRPETAESLYLLWKVTGDPKYREWGWELFRGFERWSRVPEAPRDGDGNVCEGEGAGGCRRLFTGYSTVGDVGQVPPGFMNKMETFFIAETLKYLWLLQADSPEACATRDCVPAAAWTDPVLSLRDWVLNTEAHPLPVAGPATAPRVRAVPGIQDASLHPFGLGPASFNIIVDSTAAAFNRLDPRVKTKHRLRAERD